MVARNAVLSRLDQALKKIHKGIAQVDRFAKVLRLHPGRRAA
jgi:hypothetical protein